MVKKQKEVVLYDSDWYYENEESQNFETDLDWEAFIENLKNQSQNYGNGFIAIGYLHTWQGHFIGYSDKINFSDDLLTVIEKLSGGYDRVKIYFNDKGDLELALYHHDGTNRVVIRQLKDRYKYDNYIDKIETDLYNQKRYFRL